MTVAAFVVSVFAFVASSAAALFTWKQSDSSERQAVAAEDQALSAKAQVEYARRSVELAEEQATALRRAAFRSGPTTDVAPAPPQLEPSPWSIAAKGSQGVRLLNGRARPVFDVSVDFDRTPYAAVPTTWDRVDAGAFTQFTLLRAVGMAPSQITVRWRDTPEADLREWTTALP